MKLFCRAVVIVLVIVIVILCCILMSLYAKYKIKYRDLVKEYSDEYGVEQSLIFAIIKNESDFRCDATSIQNAKGLMQIMDRTATWIVKLYNIDDEDIDLYDVEDNIKVGTLYLRYLSKKYDNRLIETISAYNAGEGKVDGWISAKCSQLDSKDAKLTIEDIEYDETRIYVSKVLKSKFYYEKLYNLE